MPRTPKTEKPSKTETLAIRLDPKVKYGLEILARQQRRSITSVVEWALNEALKQELRVSYSYKNQLPGSTIRETYDEFVLDHIWDSDEVLRLIKLVQYNADLLTYEENQLWNLIQNNALYWVGQLNETKKRYTWDTADISSLRVDLVRHDYSALKPVANSLQDKNQADIHYFPGSSVDGDRLTERIYYIHVQDELDLIEEIAPLSTGTTSETMEDLILGWATKIVETRGPKAVSKPEKKHGKKV